MATTFRRKPNRLPIAVYGAGQVFSLTLACSGRMGPFAEESVANRCLDLLVSAAERRSVRIFAYCFMPDHVHLLAQALPGASIVDFVKEFKQSSGYWYRRLMGRSLWQKSYYDHAPRSEEELLAAARYIAANPVRAGLVAAAKDYPFVGSLAWERSALVEA